MRIFDADTHISNMGGGIRITAQELIARMDKLGIEKSLVWLHPNQLEDEYCDFDAQNAYIHEMVTAYPDRLMPVGWINPRVHTKEEMLERVHQQIFDYGYRGIKFNGAQNFYDLANEELFHCILDEVARLGAFFAFHCGNDENTNPDKVKAIAKKYPNTPILMVHMGQTRCEDAIAAAMECPNILLVGSGMPDRSPVKKAVAALGAKRVCFGSDAPFHPTETYIKEYYEMFSDLSQEALQDIFANNLEALFASVTIATSAE